MKTPSPFNARLASRNLSRVDRLLVGALRVCGAADVVDLASAVGVPVFDMARAAYSLAQRGLAEVTDTKRAAVRRIVPSPALADLPATLRARCRTEYVVAVAATRRAARA